MNSLSYVNYNINLLENLSASQLASPKSFNQLASCINDFEQLSEEEAVAINAISRINDLRERMLTSILGAEASNEDRTIIRDALNEACCIAQLFSSEKRPLSNETANAIENLVESALDKIETLTNFSPVLNNVFGKWAERVDAYKKHQV